MGNIFVNVKHLLSLRFSGGQLQIESVDPSVFFSFYPLM